jgi:glutaminyl-peptide cyclotransferase
VWTRASLTATVSLVRRLIDLSVLFAASALVLAAASADGAPSTRARGAAPAVVPTYGFKIVHVYPHDPAAFTEGLLFDRGTFFESTGAERESSVRRVELATGRVLKSKLVPPPFFAEGLTLLGGRLVQLTWKQGQAFVYDPASLRMIRTFAYTGDGWGLTNNGTELIMSDGTSRLRVLDPKTAKVRRVISVTDAGKPVERLNELEYYKGEILANVLFSDRVARIDPRSGAVKGWVDLAGLLTPEERLKTDVLNGIAHDSKADRLFVTGKYWPKLFEIKIKPAQ